MLKNQIKYLMNIGVITLLLLGNHLNAFADLIHEQQIDSNLSMRILTGEEARSYFKDIADIRINLFSEYPYLYEGNYKSEESYLDMYFRSPNSAIVLVFDNDKIAGFSSSIPLSEVSEELQEPFIEQSKNVDEYLYVGEIMLYPPYRKKGLVRKFFEFHELKAKAQGYKYVVFVAVERSEDHHKRPERYRNLGEMYEHFGYHKHPYYNVSMSWKQIDSHRKESNTLGIWVKKLYKDY